MHARWFAVLLVLALVPTAAPQSAAQPALQITELLAAPDGAAGQREFVELHNPGPSTLALHGWRIEDAATSSGAVNGFTFGDEVVGPGARIVVWSNGSGDARGPAWSTSPSKTVWNDAGDSVSLLDPEGRIVDWVAYGNSMAPAPTGWENSTRPAAPSRGASLAWAGGNWSEGPPTPALAPGQQGGAVGAEVQNAAPDVALTAPPSAKPGEVVTVALDVGDRNGAPDVASWTLRSGSTTLATGNASVATSLQVRAPTTSGPWTLELEARDRAGAMGRANATVQVRDARVAVAVPESGGVRFPALVPGQRNVTSLEPFTVRNDGSETVPLLIDVSPFSALGGTIPVEGNLWVGVAAGNATPTWARYEQPLQPLPPLTPGAAWSVWLRIDAVPTPLAAGSYGTSFTVVSA